MINEKMIVFHIKKGMADSGNLACFMKQVKQASFFGWKCVFPQFRAGSGGGVLPSSHAVMESTDPTLP
jgi:hypothetical protein